MYTIAVPFCFAVLYVTKLVQIRTYFVVFVVTNYNKIIMALFCDNIRNLSVEREILFVKLAESIGITRGRCIKYESKWIYYCWAVY
jgi:hypothetical protein